MEDNFLAVYPFIWTTFLLVCLFLLYRQRNSQAILQKDYWLFLIEPWKIISFFIAGLIITVVGPYTDDPTWDHVDGAFLAIFTYLTAPWAVGMIYKYLHKEKTYPQVLPAIGVMLFSASWSYDAYLWWRDGYYPESWSSNLLVSGVLYLCAGLMWNLDYSEEEGVLFLFQTEQWPRRLMGKKDYMRIFIMALPMMIIASYLTVSLFNRA